ncbi:hypothetical protein PJ985_09040 [Streptomyces sp. ACA25]|uniref:hypothetical protein n=1 Tax=Streptomyces sp. ACA25 TaxID=3022596 RepID=UPI002307B65C|nr:hypothetical protein [Streptomyces sp. ACA25]MDB1087711.1 hypothetical protein [Streptomyces sp. ACA25]
MTSTEAAADALQDHAALWSTREIRSHAVVHAACEALVAGLDSPGLRALAACTRADADYDVPTLLPEALSELGLTFFPVGSDAGREAAAQALARRMLADGLTAREFASRIHELHGRESRWAERLAELDDEYGILECGCADGPTTQVDAEVRAEARRLAARPRRPAEHRDPRS